MNSLDFLNIPPQYYIFGKKFNKTNFGGVLFLIYIIIMIFISLIYLLDFFLNDKYIIESYILEDYYETIENSILNKEVFFTISLEVNVDIDINIDELVNRTFLKYDRGLYNGYLIQDCSESIESCRFSIIFKISKKIYDYYESGGSDSNKDIYIIYKCKDSECKDYVGYSFFERIIIWTNDFKIDHGASTPLIINKCDIEREDSCRKGIDILFQMKKHTQDLKLDLSTIIYEEKKGISRLFDRLFNKTNKYEISYIDNDKSSYEIYDNVITFHPKYEDEVDIFGQQYAVISEIKTEFNNIYTQYKRSEIIFMDVIANIGALFSTFYSIFGFIYKYYAINFDNYKIIEKIMHTKINNKQNLINSKGLIKLDSKKINEIELSNLDNEKNNISTPLMNDIPDKEDEKEKDNKVTAIKNEENENKEDNNIKIYNRILPKLSFFDFYFNNIYCSCCKRRNKQDILDICNIIISKYISVDSVLYDHLLFENLIKDYIWNNPDLNNILNNELIKELNKLI